MKQLLFIIPLMFLVVACSEEAGNSDVASDQQLDKENVITTTAEDNTDKTDIDEHEVQFDEPEEIIAAVEAMYDWQSYRADYRFAYMLEGMELYNLMKLDYVAEPMQKYALITTPYMNEEYYAIENEGVFSYDYYEERWAFDSNTDLALENEIYYSYHLLQLIVENIGENTTTQDIDGPLIANIILQEGTLMETFQYFLSSRYEPLQDLLYVNVEDVPSGSALIYFEDGQISRYELRLDVVFEDGTASVLEIDEQFEDVNQFSEIILPEAVFAG